VNSRMIRTIKREDMNGASWKTSNEIFYTSIIAIVLVSSFLIQISSVAPSEALTRYYNCIARVANKNATLSMANVDACYNLIFKGALDYYGIKQQPTFDNKDTSSEDNSEKLSDSTKRQTDNSNSKPQSEKVQGASELNDVFR
jgi:hypothetical protein